jgi:nucleoid-associated protein YgaU
MTKEAKVGLLLGLLFIIGIAVVLRGMHRNGQAALEKELIAGELSTSDKGDPLSEAVNLSAVKELSDSASAESAPAESVAITVPPAEPLAKEAEPTPTPVSQPGSTQANASGERYSHELPGAGASQPFVPPSGAIERAALNTMTVQAKTEGAVSAAGQLAHAEPGRVYEVKSGDDLTQVAVNVYGQKQGKQWSNIKRIYEANRSVLPTMDSLKIGQKLTIPPLPAEAASPRAETPAAASAKSAQSAPAASSRSAEKTTGYVVKEGDSLWKISKEKLGSGNRYKEILKLNGIHDDSNLKTGMTLKLPSK